MTELMQYCDVLVTTEEDTEKVFGIKGKDYEDAAVQLTRRFPLAGGGHHPARESAGVEEHLDGHRLSGRPDSARRALTRWRSWIASAPATRSRRA